MDETARNAWFEMVRDTLETTYISHDEPWRQSGMSGPEERWKALRKPVADCVDRSGSFLDIGCANGYLLECTLRWTSKRGLKIEPFGLDNSARLLALAKKRLPAYADHLFHGNAYDWVGPQRFDFVRTELVYVPGELEGAYLSHLMADVVAPGGKLLVANYMERDPNPARGLLPGCQPTRFILDRLRELGFEADGFCDGHDPVKDSWTRIAVLNRD